MAEYAELYQRAVYYDIALSRDIKPEFEALMQMCERYRGAPPASFLDIACGPGYHAREAARRGMRGVGLDLNSQMLDLAREFDAREGLELEWIEGDMRAFSLAEPVDLAVNMFDGIDCLLTNDDLLRHFRVIADNLTDGGLYIWDMTHPRLYGPNNFDGYVYAGERDGTKVAAHWATNNPRIDWMTGVTDVELEIHIEERDENGEVQKQVIKDRAKERWLDPQHIIMLNELAGAFDIVGWYGAYDLAQPFDNSEDAKLMVVVMQKC